MSAPVELGQRTLNALTKAIEQSQAIGPTSLDLPSWVQAIGSVLAILAAIVLGRVQYAQREKERAEERLAVEIREFASRARFFHMVASQIHRALAVAEGIGSEDAISEEFSLGDAEWIDWASSSLDRFIIECLAPLDVLSDMPLEAWPDVEAALVYRKSIASLEASFGVLREAHKVPIKNTGIDTKCYWAAIVDDIAEWSKLFPIYFDRMIMIADHAIVQAEKRGLDVRYGSGHAPLDLSAAIEYAIKERCGRYDRLAPFTGEEVDRGAALRSLLRSHHDWRPKPFRDQLMAPLVSR